MSNIKIIKLTYFDLQLKQGFTSKHILEENYSLKIINSNYSLMLEMRFKKLKHIIILELEVCKV